MFQQNAFQNDAFQIYIAPSILWVYFARSDSPRYAVSLNVRQSLNIDGTDSKSLSIKGN